MKTPKLSGKQKFEMVLEGLRGRPVAEICTAYGLGQSHYYRIRDEFLSKGHRAFERSEDAAVKRLREKNEKLTRVVGELTLELKKSEGWE